MNSSSYCVSGTNEPTLRFSCALPSLREFNGLKLILEIDSQVLRIDDIIYFWFRHENSGVTTPQHPYELKGGIPVLNVQTQQEPKLAPFDPTGHKVGEQHKLITVLVTWVKHCTPTLVLAA